MSTAVASVWDSAHAKELAQAVADNTGFCGPAVVVWIAAVWNHSRGRSQYDPIARVLNQQLFPPGPRQFFGRIAGYQESLDTILRRETNGELRLGQSTFYKYSTIHGELGQYQKPLIVRMYPDEVGLHYVTLYRSEKRIVKRGPDRIRFYWQDNGTYGERDGGNDGLYATEWRNVGENRFNWGAKRVVLG